MKRLLILCVAAAAITTELAAAAPEEDAKLLMGAWKEVSREVDGKPAPQKLLKGSKLTFEAKGKMVDTGKPATMAGYRITRTYKIDPTKKPATIDMIQTFRKTGKDGNPLTVVSTRAGIYKIDGDKLTICCLTLEGPNAPQRPKEFRTRAKSWSFLSVYKREKR